MKTYKVKDCFKGKNIYWRDSYLDKCLSKEMPVIKGGKVSYKELEETMTFKEISQWLYGSTDVQVIKKHSFSLLQIEMMIDEGHKDLLTDGYENIFPIVDKDEVFWLCVYRSARDWHVYVYQFDYVFRWFQSNRAFSRNLDSLTPNPSDLESRVKLLENDVEKIKKFLII